MESGNKKDRSHARWAEFRFSLIGPLLAAPPTHGDLKHELDRLSEKQWRHPVTGNPVRFGVSTLERWYYTALREKRDPVRALRRRPRCDSGRQRSVGARIKQAIFKLYKAHKSWSYRLLLDNLLVLVKETPDLGRCPSYSTLVRFMKATGLLKQRRRRGSQARPGMQRALERVERREVRSFEAEYVGSLWHLDFHHCSRKVLMPNGTWVTPLLLGVLDDYSRLCCHLQWYLSESARNLVHGLCQAFQKRGLPRALLTDNGSAMLAAEVEQGLGRLGVVHETTLPYSPYQNAKQEVFWVQVEGRLMAMLEGVGDLTLTKLNETTVAWFEMEYNRRRHSEIGEIPLKRFCGSGDVSRESPDSEGLRRAFTAEVGRQQRESDGTMTLDGVRFEIPSRYRQMRRVAIRYASWDLSRVWLVDTHRDTLLCPLFPLDKTKNATGLRRSLEPRPSPEAAVSQAPPESGMAPLLRKLLSDYAATGLPPAYLPQDSLDHQEEEK